MKNYKILIALIAFFPSLLWGQGTLESPGKNSIEGGVGLIRGWTCEAVNSIQVLIDDTHVIDLLPGADRPDTAKVCNNNGMNGFGSIVFWGNYGLGEHEAKLVMDGELISTSKFTIAGASATFLKDASRTTFLDGFPDASKKTVVQWSEANQNFIIRDVLKKSQSIFVSDLSTSKTSAKVYDLNLGHEGNDGRIATVRSSFGERLRVTVCSDSPTIFGLCSEGGSGYIDRAEGEEVTVDASSLGGSSSYVWVQMVNGNGQVITPSDAIEFSVVYTPDS